MVKNLFWCPVRKGLPENMDRVLVTIRIGEKVVVRSGSYYYGLFSIDNGDVWKANAPGITAWMPLPNAYEGETKDDS